MNEEKKRIHYGVIFSTMENANQYEVWRGIESYADEHDINLTAYIGAYQGADNNVSTFFETCFGAAGDNDFLDGIILFSGFVAQNAGLDNFRKYLAKIPKSLPAVSVSIPLRGVPSVLAQSFNGIYNATVHLIKRHGKKKIAFVKGPDGHPEAEERLSGYRKALEDSNLEFDERYVLPGAFMQESGKNAVVLLIDERKVEFDAVVASNDQMAIGVIEELKKRKILVPTDVAVTGFDDDITSASYIPSLSTARQDFFETGLVSIQTLEKIVNGEQVKEITHVEPSLVKRQSCGCLDQNLSETVYDDITDNTSLHSFVLGSFRTIFTAVPRTQVEEWATELVDVLNRKPFYAENFLRKFNEILIKHYHYYKELRSWHKALNILAMGVELHGDDDGSAHSKLSALISATSFVHEIRFKKQTLREIDLNSLRTHIRRLTSALVLTFDLDAMVEKVHAWLPTLMINTALIGVYRTPIKIEDPEADRTIETLVGFDDDKKFNISQNMWNPVTFSRYPTFDGFDMERERRSLFLIPLFFDDFELGAILIPYDVNIPVDAYETLRVSISTAVKGAELISTIRTLSITDELTGLLNRRGFFQFSYSRIYHLSRNSDSVPMVMFMDMDGLKAINDTYGHNEGDVAISAFANILQDVLRKDDIVGRVGGDEFVVFSTVRKAENSEQVVQRIRNKIDEYNAKQLHPFLVSSSIGAVVLSAATKECFEEAMLSADNVLYAEKMEKKKKGLSRK